VDVNEVGKVRLTDALLRRILHVSLDALTHRCTDAFYQHQPIRPISGLPVFKRPTSKVSEGKGSENVGNGRGGEGEREVEREGGTYEKCEA